MSFFLFLSLLTIFFAANGFLVSFSSQGSDELSLTETFPRDLCFDLVCFRASSSLALLVFFFLITFHDSDNLKSYLMLNLVSVRFFSFSLLVQVQGFAHISFL